MVPQPKPGLMHLGEAVEATRDTLIRMITTRAETDSVEAPIPWAGWLGKIMCKKSGGDLYYMWDWRCKFVCGTVVQESA